MYLVALRSSFSHVVPSLISSFHTKNDTRHDVITSMISRDNYFYLPLSFSRYLGCSFHREDLFVFPKCISLVCLVEFSCIIRVHLVYKVKSNRGPT